MSANPEEISVVVERDGVSVEKTFEPDDFPVPAIAFVVRSEREEPVDVRLVDQVPENVPAEDIGFHPRYGAEFWSVEDGMIVFEREFEAGEEYTTVYGLRASDTDEVDRFLSEPDLEDVSPGLDEVQDSGQAVREVIEGVELDEPDDEDVPGDEEDVEPLTLNDPTAEASSGTADTDAGAGGADESAAETGTDDLEAAISAVDEEGDVDGGADEAPATGSEPADATGSAAAGPAGGNVAATLAAQLREGNVSQEDLRALREALDVQESPSDRARISRLQTEVSDLQAYTDALEEFLDENGEAQTLLRELRNDIERIEGELSETSDRAQSAEARVADLDDQVASVSEDVEGVADRVDDVEGDVTSVEERADEFVDRLEGIEERVDTVEDRAEDVESVRDRLDSIESDLEGLRTVEERMSEIEGRLEDAQDDIEGLAEMREQLSSVFGAEAGGGGETGDDGDDE